MDGARSLGNRFATTVDATYSLNLNQASTFDLNFNPAQQFALATEGNRPVYARATSIVPTTGSIAPSEARVASAYSHVNELRSDMKSESKQITVSISPTSFICRWGCLPRPDVQRVERRQAEAIGALEQVKELAHQFAAAPVCVAFHASASTR